MIKFEKHFELCKYYLTIWIRFIPQIIPQNILDRSLCPVALAQNLHVDFLDVIDSLGILKTAEYSDKEDQYMKDFFVFQYFNLYLDIIRAISAHQAAGIFLLAYRHADREPPIFV